MSVQTALEYIKLFSPKVKPLKPNSELMKQKFSTNKWMRFTYSNFKQNKKWLNFPGVYVLIDIFTNKVIYVGSSMKIGSRAYSCWVEKKMKDTDKYIMKIKKEKKKFEHLMIEAKLIYRLKPLWNIHFKNK